MKRSGDRAGGVSRRLPLLGRAAETKSGPRDDRAPIEVRAWIVGAVEDAGALRFARTLAETSGCPLARTRDELGDPSVIAVGVDLVGHVAPRLTVVVGGTLPRSAWRPELRAVEAQVAIAEARDDLATRLAERLRADSRERTRG